MLYSKHLLSKYVQLPSDYKVINKEFIIKLFEIEHGEHNRVFPDLLVIGKVIDVKKHPNADTLFVCQVNCGSHGNFQICTGGENVSIGQFVPTALPGCYLPQIDLTIGSRKMRGEDSNGMICSKGELGINEDEDKHWIWAINEDLACDDNMIGTSFHETFGWMEDTVFEVESVAITNRPDLWGHLGLAIEANAIFPQYGSNKIQEIITKAKDFGSKTVNSLGLASNPNSVINSTSKCSYYSLSTMKDSVNSDSVFSGRLHLMDLGHTPKRNWIDYSNYFMSLTGQPIHVFDADKIKGAIVIKEALGGETFIDLTGKEHELALGDIIITDQEKILALAGIIGGQESAFSEQTTNIGIEIANFDPVQIRKTSTRLGLKTDAAVRFEKGINPLWTAFCVYENYDIVNKTHIEHKTGSVDSISVVAQDIWNKQILNLDFAKANYYILGQEKADFKQQTLSILEKLGYNIIEQRDNHLVCNAPIRRSDIQIIQDVYEDLARHIGLENIPELPSPIYPKRSTPGIVSFQHKLAHRLINNYSFNQVESYPWYNGERIKLLELDANNHFELLNPTDSNTPYLAQSLIPGLIELAKKNYRIQLPITIFEIGKTFSNSSTYTNDYGNTKKLLSLLIVDKKNSTRNQDRYLDLDMIIHDVGQSCGVEFSKSASQRGYFHPKKQCDIIGNKITMGTMGQIHPMVLDHLGFQDDIVVYYGEIDIIGLYDNIKKKKTSQYSTNQDQLIERDLSFEIPNEKGYSDIIDCLNASTYIKSYKIIDLYRADSSPIKSITLRLTIQGDSLTTEDINNTLKSIIHEVELTGASLKGVRF